MEKENITLDPRSSFTPSSSADIPVPPDGLVQRSTRIKRIQTTAMLLLFFAAVINYLDRSSLSVANLTIREEGNDSNLLIVFYVQIMPDDFVMQLHRF
ncbi:hypothetical protein RVB1_36560 [Escherichia coli]|uniref:hypothetical protein n=1 Tax=Escherichia coli TaxID=562 RepID=UPI0007B608B7|nr:hypothetical protein RVB1_36560 [Escherichia coli]SVH55382.1 putative transport protein [Shigella flexneri]